MNMQLTPGTVLDSLTITDLTTDGGGVARHEGHVVFLDKGLPGEVVGAKVVGVRKRSIIAQVTATYAESPHAATAWCPHFSECGGCLWQHFAPQAALEWKANHTVQALERIGKIKPAPRPYLIAAPELRCFRNKMTYAFGVSEEGPVLGLRRRNSHDIVAVTQ